MAGGFSENITLLQRRPVDDLALTLALAYSLREERVINALNEQAQNLSEPPTPASHTFPSPHFLFGKTDSNPTTEHKDKEKAPLKKTPSDVSPKSLVVQTNGPGLSRWGRTFFKTTNTSNPNLPEQNDIPKTPPPPVETTESPPLSTTRFSPGAWGASLSAASRKLNKLRISSNSAQSEPSMSPSSRGHTPVALDDRSGIAGKVTAVVRESFERRGEIIQKVGGWVANTNDPEASLLENEKESAAAAEIRRLEREVGRKGGSVGISPEEYIARIKRRQEEREAREGKGASLSVGIDDPLGVGNG
jgi:hypothetical protein